MNLIHSDETEKLINPKVNHVWKNKKTFYFSIFLSLGNNIFVTFYAWNLLDLFIAFLRLFFSLQNSKLSKYMRVIVQYIESCAQMQFRFFFITST